MARSSPFGNFQPKGQFSKPDRFGIGKVGKGGIYPSRGKGHHEVGEAAFPDLLEHWNRSMNWSAWRAGLDLALSGLFTNTNQYQAFEVLRVPPFQPFGLEPTPVLGVGFPSTASPEGRWTVSIKPRGTEVSSFPVSEEWSISETSIDLEADNPYGYPAGTRRLLVGSNNTEAGIELQGPTIASSLVGELVEDTVISTTPLVLAEEDDEAVILLCVAVYPQNRTMVFDGSRYWKRERQENGTTILRMIPIGPKDPIPRFRQGRYLTQITSYSCNCPKFMQMAYGDLREQKIKQMQMMYPQLSANSPRDNTPLEGVGRRFREMYWARIPHHGCKHVHAARFAVGSPCAEPDDLPALIGDYWSALRALAPHENLGPPLMSDQFFSALNQRTLQDSAYRALGSTITTGSMADVCSVTMEAIAVQPNQVQEDGALLFKNKASLAEALRFTMQHFPEDPKAAESAVLGDVWAGRLTQQYSYPYLGPGEIADTPFYRPINEGIKVRP